MNTPLAFNMLGVFFSMIAAVVFDVDGVVIKKREMYFTERLAREHGVPYVPIAARDESKPWLLARSAPTPLAACPCLGACLG